MAAPLENLREELLPGLLDIRSEYAMIPRIWERVFAEEALFRNFSMPLPVAVAAGVAAVVIRNPSVTRRSLFSWRA